VHKRLRCDRPLGKDRRSKLESKVRCVATGVPALTIFEPLALGSDCTLVRVKTTHGRKHQIRAHAQYLGHSVVGDKMYGPDERLFLEFLSTGMTPRLEKALGATRHMLHCLKVDFTPTKFPLCIQAAVPEDMSSVLQQRLGLSAQQLSQITRVQPRH